MYSKKRKHESQAENNANLSEAEGTYEGDKKMKFEEDNIYFILNEYIDKLKEDNFDLNNQLVKLSKKVCGTDYSYIVAIGQNGVISNYYQLPNKKPAHADGRPNEFFDQSRILGRGYWGQGLLVQDKNKVDSVVKQIRFEPNSELASRDAAKNEASILHKLQHSPNINLLFSRNSRKAYILQRYFEGQSLDAFDTESLSEIEQLKLIIEVYKKVKLINEKGIAHNDLQGGNILIKRSNRGSGWEVNIIDFGNSTASESPIDGFEDCKRLYYTLKYQNNFVQNFSAKGCEHFLVVKQDDFDGFYADKAIKFYQARLVDCLSAASDLSCKIM